MHIYGDVIDKNQGCTFEQQIHNIFWCAPKIPSQLIPHTLMKSPWSTVHTVKVVECVAAVYTGYMVWLLILLTTSVQNVHNPYYICAECAYTYYICAECPWYSGAIFVLVELVPVLIIMMIILAILCFI